MKASSRCTQSVIPVTIFIMKNLNLINNSTTTEPVTCLGLNFENDKARRSYFLVQLREQLQHHDFKKIAGLPNATDEAILALSDPPYYTACPNPWFSDFITEWAETSNNNETYLRGPFAADVSEGKNNPIYNAHSYHTKVPHKAIMRYILHYTDPGDIVFDSFGGTGMTGIAAQLCGDRRAVEALGYRVLSDGTIETQEENDKGKFVFKPFSKLGARQAILNDLSPAATFIAYNYNTPVDVIAFEQEALQILREIEAESGWMYQTLHSCTKDTKEYAKQIKKIVLGEMDCPNWLSLGHINYTVWSDIFICPECVCEVVFWEIAVDKATGKVNKKFPCPHCDTSLTKRRLERAWVLRFDKAIGETIRLAKQVPVLINYTIGNTRLQKSLDEFDFALLEKLDNMEIPYWFPTDALPDGYNTNQPMKSHGVTHLHHFYTKRSLSTLSALRQKTEQADSNSLRNICRFLFQQGAIGFSKLNRYSPSHFSQNNRNLSGTLYIGSQIAEVSPSYAFTNKLKRLKMAFANNRFRSALISTQSATKFKISDSCIDYIFLDPPFGANIMYSELNFLWEGWLKVFTNNEPEAIVNKAQGKDLSDYRSLMVASFKEAFRILKPGHWITVEFSNTQASVWNTLQTALQEAGFIIANVSTLDKKQGSFKAVTTTTAVRQDLIISAYKPDGDSEKLFEKAASVWEFVRRHLKYLPLTKTKDGKLEFIAEREPRILYDRTVAYFISHGYSVPLSSQQFQADLREHFKEKDGMIFLFEQFEEYEQKRKQAKSPPQLELFVSDERSAIDWLHHFLKKRPSTRQEIHPEFTKLIGAGWKKHEVMPELDSLLEHNFLKYNGKGLVPSQIQSYLSSHYEDCSDLATDDLRLQQRAAKCWYVADPSKAQDLEKIRDNHLLREFKQYRQSEKRLKEFRLEAMRAGFKTAWAQQDYQTIIEMAEKIPQTVLYEDDKLLQLYDLAMIRVN